MYVDRDRTGGERLMTEDSMEEVSRVQSHARGKRLLKQTFLFVILRNVRSSIFQHLSSGPSDLLPRIFLIFPVLQDM